MLALPSYTEESQSGNDMLQPESSVINLGPPGSGKSTIGNILLTGSAEKQVFLAMDAPDQGGVTRILNSKTGYLFGNKSNEMIEYFDSPGVGDYTLDMEKVLESFSSQLKTKKLDAGIITIEANANRFNLEELMTIQFFAEFFTKIKPETTWLCITHCDQRRGENSISEEWIRLKLAKFKECELEIPETNVILFDKTPESLYQLAERLTKIKGEMKITQNMVGAATTFSKNIPRFVQSSEDIKLKKELEILKQEISKKEEEMDKEEKEEKLEIANMQSYFDEAERDFEKEKEEFQNELSQEEQSNEELEQKLQEVEEQHRRDVEEMEEKMRQRQECDRQTEQCEEESNNNESGFFSSFFSGAAAAALALFFFL